MRVQKTNWCSEDGNRVLLELDRTRRHVSTPSLTIQEKDLPLLEAAARECREVLAACAAAGPGEGRN